MTKDYDDGYGIEAVKNNLKNMEKNGGLSKDRPTHTKNDADATPYFDIELGKPIWFNGTEWVDATGTAV